MRFAVTKRRATVVLLLGFLSQSGTCVAPRPGLTDRRMDYIIEHTSVENYRRWDEELKRAEAAVAEYLTPRARELLKKSPLTHQWLDPHPLLKNKIPGALYFSENNRRVVDRETIDGDYLEQKIMHEIGHLLDDEGLISRQVFQLGYGRAKDEGMRQGIDAHITESYNPKMVDITGERIGHVLEWGYTGKYEIPRELIPALSPAIDVKKLEVRRAIILVNKD